MTTDAIHRSLLALLAALAIAAAPATQPSASERVLQAARSFADGGGYEWRDTGTPEEIRFKDERILGRSAKGTYCSGFTFAVAMRVAAELNLLGGKSVDQIRQFQRQWYGAVGDEQIREQQASLAMQNLGIGGPVPFDDARPGDFVQFWRTTKSGHSAVFLGWVEKDGKPIGFRYRSSQKSTGGIGDNTEYFSDSGMPKAHVLRARTYFGRLNDRPL